MQPKPDETAVRPVKRPYSPPQLIEYGDVSELTRTGGISAKDHEGAASRKIGG